jgi:beta-phosphoglucomutase-like phosphatase (HAD superfamily)
VASLEEIPPVRPIEKQLRKVEVKVAVESLYPKILRMRESVQLLDYKDSKILLQSIDQHQPLVHICFGLRGSH